MTNSVRLGIGMDSGTFRLYEGTDRFLQKKYLKKIDYPTNQRK